MLHNKKMEIIIVALISVFSFFGSPVGAQSEWPTDDEAMKSRRMNDCTENPEKTLKALDALEEKYVCLSLPPEDCYKLILSGAKPNENAGKIAAASALGIGILKIDPKVHLVCGKTGASAPLIWELLLPYAWASVCQLSLSKILDTELMALSRAAEAEGLKLRGQIAKLAGVAGSDVVRYLEANPSATEKDLLKKFSNLAPGSARDIAAKFRLVATNNAVETIVQNKLVFLRSQHGYGSGVADLEKKAAKGAMEGLEKFFHEESFLKITSESIKSSLTKVIKIGAESGFEIPKLLRVARGLSLTAVFLGAKAVFASTGVLAPGAVAMQSAEEAVKWGTSMTDNECFTAAQMEGCNTEQCRYGLTFIPYGKLCKPSGEWSQNFANLFQLDKMTRLKVAQANPKLCTQINELSKKDFLDSKLKAQCLGTDGSFKLTDAATSTNQIETKVRAEAKKEGLTGSEADQYIAMSTKNVGTWTHEITRSGNQLDVNFTNPTTNMASCAKFSVNLEDWSPSKERNCETYTRSVTKNVFAYASISNYCAGQSGKYGEFYASAIALDRSSTGGSGTPGQPEKTRK